MDLNKANEASVNSYIYKLICRVDVDIQNVT